MNKYKQLIKNVGLLTLGSFASKVLSFLFVPLYTNILTTQEYGIFDLIITTISLLLPIFSLNIIEAVLRFPIERKDDKDFVSDILTIGWKYTIIGCMILFVCLFINRIFEWIPILVDYDRYIFFLYVAEALNQLLLSIARATDHIKEVSIAGVLISICMVGLNLLFLLYFKLGLIGYFWAYIISNVFAVIYYVIKLHIFAYIRMHVHDKSLSREMISYSFPMVFNTVGWWINNASDRYVVTWFCGTAINGIYSVAYKIPSILNVLHSIFMQAWILSAVREYKKEGNAAFFRNVYQLYGCILTVTCACLIMFTKPIARLLFHKEFFLAWRYSSGLLIAVIFGALSGVLGGIFSAKKNSKMFAISTCIGALINIGLNIFLVRYFGASGAAIATAISSYVVLLIRIKHTKKYISLDLNLARDNFIYILLVLQGISLLLIDCEVLFCVVSIFIIFIILFLYRKDISFLYVTAKQYAKSNIHNDTNA